MEMINFTDLTSGYRDRMRRLALMEPLDELGGKRTKDENGANIDMRGLGLLTLLFFFERRLTREYKTSTSDLTDFLFKMTRDTYSMEWASVEKIARGLITTFRPSRGKKRTFEFFNWDTKQREEIEYSILKDNDFDVKTQTQYYTLDEDGLELLFATKEFYSEFQISINQLLLKQQIKKDEFHGALRQVREMELNVDALRESMEKMKLEILRSIVSEETFERYKYLLEEAYIRFQREDEEFNALKQFITETRDTLYADNIKQTEQKSYELILKIQHELEAVHSDHTILLGLTMELRTTALATAQESLYYTGIQSFNFDQDIVSTILAKPLAPDIMKGVTHPFLKVEEKALWSPMTVLAEQNIIEERAEAESHPFIEALADGVENEYRQWIAAKYADLMEEFLAAYETGNANTLKGWMRALKDTDSVLIKKRYFYSFWLMMHQYSPLTNDGSETDDGEMILQEAIRKLGSRLLAVTETTEVLRYDSKYSIQNMTIVVKEQSDELS